MQYILKDKCKNVDSKSVNEISAALNINPLLAKVLGARGIKDINEARDFLHPSSEQLLNPFLFKDMEDCVSLIKNKISLGEQICIYGDYDVDGVSGSAILYKALKSMGANVDCILPSRMQHGYGLSCDAVSNMSTYSLLITVDCGITNVKEIALAKSMGLNVIVTDHHECGALLPVADYILNPKREEETYAWRELCGAGIAFKLANALTGDYANDFLDIAAIATIADIVPLIGENRTIAKLGLDKLNRTENIGLKKLIESAKLKPGMIDSHDVAFRIAPRMNAAGRIATARIVFDLLTTTDEIEAVELASKINTLNADRQQRQERVITEALEMEEKHPSDKFIMHFSDDWDVGIIGLAASKLCEKYNKPAMLLAKVDDKYVGSARSIEGVNIYEALHTQSDLYEKFGGHSGAAGLTVRPEHLKVVKDNVNVYLNSKYNDTDFLPTRRYDLTLTPKEITNGLITDLNKLQPFGYKNEPVNILFKKSSLLNVKPVGSDRHSRFLLKSGGYSINAIAFSTKVDSLPANADIIGTVQINDFDGFPQVMADTFSYSPSDNELFAAADSYVRHCEHPTDKNEYFCNRRELGDIYSLLKSARDKRLKFKDMGTLIKFIQNNLHFLTIKKIAFAMNVLTELKLIDIIKSANINIAVYGNKCALEDSGIYKKYYMEL